MKSYNYLRYFLWYTLIGVQTTQVCAQKPLKIGLDGLIHGHVNRVFNHPDSTTFQLVGIAEPNKELALLYAKRYGFPMNLVYSSLKEMVKATKPEAVMAFNATNDHLNTLQVCAPKGIHVMVEKPLAVNMKHANKMAELSRKYDVYLLTNYETTWYPSNQFVNEKLNEENEIGIARRIVVNDGHSGPKEIGVREEFFEWLTDPKLNGGGAITDFGCYGANLITWLNKGELPQYVFASTNTYKPDIYKRVDDDATILLEYDDMVGIIQASWNWPFSRKDMEVYGETGYLIARDKFNVKIKANKGLPTEEKLAPREKENSNEFNFFKAVVRNEITLNANDLSGLENNLRVVEILDAARKSAKTGKKIPLK